MGEFLGPYAISGKAIDQQLAESGVYQALLTNTPGDIAADCTAAADECTTGDDETWDFSGGKTLTLVINGRVNDPITIDFVDGDFVDAEAGLAAEVKAVLDADADFAAVATSAVTNTNHVTITTKALGTTAELYASGTANDVMGFVEVGAKVNGETDPSTVEISTVNGANDGAVARKQVAISVLDAVTAGSALADTQLQLVTKGRVVSGEYTNAIVVESDGNGEIELELVAAIGGADELFLEIAGPTGFNLVGSNSKGVDSTREQVDQSGA